MTPGDIPSLVAELRELLAKATPGPWAAHHSSSTKYLSSVSRAGYLGASATSVALVGASDLNEQNSNAELIVAAVNALPALLDALTPKEAELVNPPREDSGDAVVIQADRDAAADSHTLSAEIDAEIRGGKRDDHPWVQGFMRHRLAYTPKAPTASHDAARERIARGAEVSAMHKANADRRTVSNKLRMLINRTVTRFVGDYDEDREELIDAILAALPTTDGAGDASERIQPLPAAKPRGFQDA